MPTPEQQKAKKAAFDALTPEQKAEAYERTLSPAYRAEQAKHLAELARLEQEYQPAPWPLGKSPPSTQVIRGEVVPEPLDDDAIMDKLRRAKVRARRGRARH